jgi:hypothetical protein
MITDKWHDLLDLDLLRLIQLGKETEGNKGAQTIGVGRERGVRSHVAGRGRRGGRGLTQGMQCRLGDDGSRTMRSRVGRWHRVRRIHEEGRGDGGGGASRRSSAPSIG